MKSKEVPVAAAEDLTPTVIRRKRFEMVRRGFDPQEVGAFLEQVASRLAAAERSMEEAEERLAAATGELADARAAEEALQMTMVVATQAKDEMLERAKSEAEEIRTSSRREADGLIIDARRQSLELIEDSRREADDVVTAARSEHRQLLGQVDQLRGAVASVRELLAAVGADSALARAEHLIEHPDEAVVSFDASPAVEPVAEPAKDDTGDAEPGAASEISGPEEPASIPETNGVVADDMIEEVAVDLSAEAETPDEAAEVERLLKQLRGS